MIDLSCLPNSIFDYTDEELEFKAFFEKNGKTHSYDIPLEKPETNTVLTESELLGNRNVIIKRHLRYNPEFWHSHQFFEMIYVIEGKCENHIFGENEILQTGDLCILSPSVYHSIWAKDAKVINILIKKSNIQDYFSDILRDKNVISDFLLNSLYMKDFASCLFFSTGDDIELKNLCLQMIKQQNHEDNFSKNILNSMLSIFLNLLLRNHSKTAHYPEVIKKQNDMVTSIVNIIYKDYKNISLTVLADKMGYSTIHCCRLIKEYTGTTFYELVQQIRFHQAEIYLKETAMTVSEISEECGYQNPEGFIRAFKRMYKHSPSEWRKTRRFSD